MTNLEIIILGNQMLQFYSSFWGSQGPPQYKPSGHPQTWIISATSNCLPQRRNVAVSCGWLAEDRLVWKDWEYWYGRKPLVFHNILFSYTRLSQHSLHSGWPGAQRAYVSCGVNSVSWGRHALCVTKAWQFTTSIEKTRNIDNNLYRI